MKNKNSWFILFSLLLNFTIHQLESSPSKAVFEKFPNPYFVETGSYRGDGIQMAIETGFPCIYSIELSPLHYKHCKKRFASVPSVHLVLGDSSKHLKKILAKIDAPITFWLDGHYSSGNTAKGKTNCPLLEELAAIANHPIKTHTILIDDVRLLGTHEFDFIELEKIVEAILQINPDYIIGFEDGYAPRDILTAYIHK